MNKTGETHIFYFSKAGEETARQIQGLVGGQTEGLKNMSERLKELFIQGNLLIFVGAMGIAVRGIAPLIQSKETDPAVLVVDDHGFYVIPILSGHLGGANGYARDLAAHLGAKAVITTATDLAGVFAVDSFARAHNLSVAPIHHIKAVSARLLCHLPVGLISDYPVKGTLPSQDLHVILEKEGKEFKETDPKCPMKGLPQVGIYVGVEDKKPFEKTLQLIPKTIILGAGARRGIQAEAFEAFVLDELKKLNVSPKSLAAIATIDLKKDENAFLQFSQKYRLPIIVYTGEELKVVAEQFDGSAFVRDTTGTSNVCQSAAYLASGKGRLLTEKMKGQGMTLAIAEKDYILEF